MNTDANRNVISTVAYVTNRDSYVSIYQFDPNHNLILYLARSASRQLIRTTATGTCSRQRPTG